MADEQPVPPTSGAVVGRCAALLGALGASVAAWEAAAFLRGRRSVDERWYRTVAQAADRVEDLGATRWVEITPLVEWAAEREDLLTEAGVSYYVRTEERSILFDMGDNAACRFPSPLATNAALLDVPLQQVDAVFISHAHSDHLGGMEGEKQRRILLTDGGVHLARSVPAYCPVPLSGTGVTPVVCDQPRVIGPGLASTGAIPRYLFPEGELLEHGLVVRVEGHGLVLISGCGHPGLDRFLLRCEQVFGGPFGAFVGGLHLPVKDSRAKRYGVPLQRLLCTGKPPWLLPSELDAARAATELQSRQVPVVALSPHDSCDWTLEYFHRRFGEGFHRLTVGRTLRIGSA